MDLTSIVSAILLLSMTSVASQSAASICTIETAQNERLTSFAKNLSKNTVYRFASGRSKLLICKAEQSTLTLDFKNGDKVIYDLNEIAPSTEVLLTKPLHEKQAFLIAQRAMAKVDGCSLNLLKPSETKIDATVGTIKTYWCKESSAMSLTTNANGKITRIRTWLLH